jgi:hypothetical protein
MKKTMYFLLSRIVTKWLHPSQGLHQGFEKEGVIDLCKKEDAVINFNYPVGKYVLESTPW